MSPTLRNHPRFEARDSIRFQLEDRDAMRTLWTQDVSKGGLFVQTDDPPPMGSKVRVQLSTPDGNVTLQAEVVHVLSEEIAAQFNRSPGVGLQFVELNREQRQAIDRYIDGIVARLGVDDEPSEAGAADTVAMVRQLVSSFEANDLYAAIGVEPRASQEEIEARFAELDQILARPPLELSPPQHARVRRARMLLHKISSLLADTERRLEYDLRQDFVFAEERLSDGDQEVAQALRNRWASLHPDRLDEAEKHVATAVQYEQLLEFQKAATAGAAALRYDPFNWELREALTRWQQGRPG